MARKFAELDIHTPSDLAATYPRDYKDWRHPTPIAEIIGLYGGTRPPDPPIADFTLYGGTRPPDPPAADFTLYGGTRPPDPPIADSRGSPRAKPTAGTVNATRGSGGAAPRLNEQIVLGRVVRVWEFRGRVPVVNAELDDGSGRIKATWFGRRGFAGKLTPGERLFVHGRAAVKRSRGGASVELNVLNHRVLAEDEAFAGEIVPVYRASKELSSRTIASVIERNFETLAACVPETLPPAVRAKHGYGTRRDAWRAVHRPPSPEAAGAARERLIFEEFFAIALAAAVKRARRQAGGGATAMVIPPGLQQRFEASLGFVPTGAQRAAIAAIWGDMTQPAPMNRLLQGDVGSGKTLVAAAAIVLAAANRVQSALMAPTEILASQHAQKLAPLLLPLGVRVDALFGGMGAKERAAVRGRLASGECDLVVGTQALIVDSVEFRDLGLAIIDEQHRFGVAQRAKLRAKSRAPHTLHMTATPIPRTLAQTKYADLDVTVIDELPPGRTPIDTYVLRESRKARAYEFVRKNVERGRQAYVVAPAIDESESALTSALGELEVLRESVFPDLRVELLHGRMTGREKETVMSRFARGEADVLLATTVVEVGVDVPNASVMVILDADRYGLAQLHQLRGRVGRGVARSYCLLIAPDARPGVERLEILARTTDGFEIAEEDLRLRGEGEFAGTAQAGGGEALLGDLLSDFAVYVRAKADADALVATDPGLARPEHAALRALLDDEASARATLLSS